MKHDMTHLEDLAKAAQAKETASILGAILAQMSATLDGFSPVVAEKDGTVDLDGVLFTTVSGGLRMLGTCPVCLQILPSKRIRTMGDIASLMDNFVPDKHHCMDVDS